MDCLACGSETKTKESMDRGITVERKRICACGAYFFTTETPDKRTLRAIGKVFPPEGGGNPGQGSGGAPPNPAQDSTPPAQDRHGGVGGALPPDLGPDPDPDRKGSPTTERDPEIWTVGDWCRKFGIAWTGRYQRFYGMESDGKACGRLAGLMERMPRVEILDAQRRAQAMFRAFLASEAPAVVKAKHPFGFFVTEFGALRVDDLPDPSGKKDLDFA